MNPPDFLSIDVQYMLKRLADLMREDGLPLTTDLAHNRIIVERPNAAVPGVVIVELRGAKT